jgi:hypothetical protein
MPKQLLQGMLTVLMLGWILTLTGCATNLTVIPSDKQVLPMKSGKPFTPQVDGWFVPNARMLEILNALDKDRLTTKQF